jgi:hypothetical protein
MTAVLAIAIIFVLLAAVIALVTAPLRRTEVSPLDRDSAPVGSTDTSAELEAAREAKYREIRDAEMDFRTGKLSQADYEVLDAELRAEALEILDRIEEPRSES